MVSLGGLRALTADLPEWVRRPEFETNAWLNGALEQLWPHLSHALSDKIGTAVGKVLARITPLGITLSFREFNLGNEPMRLLSVKQTGSLSTSKDEVVLDFDARWCGDPTIVLNVAIMGLTLRVRLQELQVLGPLRVCLANFDDRLPCFHVLKVAFVSQPEVQFSLSLIGGDIDMLPGVKEMVTEIVGKSLARALVWPKYVKVPIAPGKEGRGGGDFRAGVIKSDAAAILELKLVRGRKLRNTASFGVSDPFVTMRVTNSSRPEVKSSVIIDDLNPRWNETFKIVLDDPGSQNVQLVVCDYSALAEDAKMKRLGRAIRSCAGMCFGWNRRFRKKVYNGLAAPKKGNKLEKKETTGPGGDADSGAALFQTVMGTGRIVLKDLKPFEKKTLKCVLTKDALSVLRVFSDGGSSKKERRRMEAGSLELEARLVPLSSSSARVKRNLEGAGRASQRQIARRREARGGKVPEGMVKRYLENDDSGSGSDAELDSESDPDGGGVGEGGSRDGARRRKRGFLGRMLGFLNPLGRLSSRKRRMGRKAAAREARLTSAAIEHLVCSALGGDASEAIVRADLLRLKPHLNGLLYVTLVKGEGLVSKDINGYSDPYFKLKLKTQKWRSRVKYKTLDPLYDEQTEFVVSPADLISPGVVIKVECWDKDLVGKEFMGEVDVSLRDIVRRSLSRGGAEVYERVALKGVDHGAVHMKFRFQAVDVSQLDEEAALEAALASSGASSRARKGSERDGGASERATRKRGWVSMFGFTRGNKGQKIKLRDWTSAEDDPDDPEDDDSDDEGVDAEFEFGGARERSLIRRLDEEELDAQSRTSSPSGTGGNGRRGKKGFARSPTDAGGYDGRGE